MIEHLIAYKENDLSNKVIVPLFKKMFPNARVEFTGGGIEKGRDIIVYKKDDFGFNEYIGVQVKKIEATPNSSSKSFQQLLNQLSQMKNEGVVDPQTGDKVKIRYLIFITPYSISDRSLDSHQGAFKDVLEMGVKIIDGNLLSNLINENMPELIRTITGDKTYIGEKIKPGLSNQALMSALNFNGKKNICDIYCETSLVAGNKSLGDSGNYSLYKQIGSDYLHNIATFNQLSLDNECIRLVLDVDFFDQISFSVEKEQYNLLRNIDGIIEKTTNEINQKTTKIKNFIINSPYRDKYPNLQSKDFEGFIKVEYRSIEIPDNFALEFHKEIIYINKLFDERSTLLQSNVENRQAKDSLGIETKITINSQVVCNRFNELLQDVIQINKVDAFNVKKYLALSKNIEDCKSILNRYTTCFSVIPKDIESKSVRIFIEDAFETNLNIVVLGEAGSGKTTNLQHYAHKLYQNKNNELIIYMTLNDLASLSSKDSEHCLLTGIKNYLHNLGLPDFTEKTIHQHLNENRTKLILDSIDEAVAEFDWIIFKLREFANNYKNCQIITSSRYTVSQVTELGFYSISLLPFEQEQKISFFRKWFNNDMSVVNKIITHLGENPKLDNIITNPLSATIMATLQESDVPLPKTEASLYKKRFELLSGLFDRFKGINRQSIQPELMLDAARFLAFKMHLSKRRSLRKHGIVTLLREFCGDESKANEITESLINPSEILLINFDGSYGFGHLRFQEYLASEQLVKSRNIATYKLITNPWWHDVYLLYSQHAYEIEWLITEAAYNGYALRVEKLLRKMIENRNQNEFDTLTTRFEIALADERD
jgi:hypothetical protein